MVYLFCSDLLLFSRKFAKVVRDANRYKMVDIIAPSINTRTSLLKSAKASSLFFFSYIYVEGIGKLLKPKTRIFRLILNSRPVFKNHQYFMILKFNFGAFFHDTFFLCGITPNHLRLRYQCTPNDHHSSAPLYGQTFDANPSKVYIFLKLNNCRLRRYIHKHKKI